MNLFLQSNAIISDCGLYRYRLSRLWDRQAGQVVFIMLNPSTADAEKDDPTIRRCMGFARAWGFGGIDVVNLFAARCTDPDELRNFADPIGPDNDAHLYEAARYGKRFVAAWGAHEVGQRSEQVLAIFRSFGQVECLGLTKQGRPRHPLYARGDSRLLPIPSPSQIRSIQP